EWPEVGDMVIATVVNITSYGVDVRLDEYDKEGLLHVSEVASRWVRNVRDYVREGQKVVLKVLRVQAAKGQVDLSRRRVTKRDKKEKLLSWKKDRKAESLLRTAAEKLNISFEEAYEKAGALIENAFGDLHQGLEKTAKDGVDVLLELGIDNDLAVTLEEIAKEKIQISLVNVKGILELQNPKPKGVLIIKDTLKHAKEVGESEGADVSVYLVSPPNYRIVVSADDYKTAENVLEKATASALDFISKSGGKGAFNREK
ncbi:translation initiation factor IF-2 subunit alpha, partial [Candidatus Bathyarchaeota archaeon]|nr:translation initiation factor IF-2 subunit alpha [Candidatus Bathyarchaeota archaeon]